MRTLWRFIAGFFKWTWRLLNFVREMVLNLFFYFSRTGWCGDLDAGQWW
ncbi:signal peptide peptidase SppA, 67K type [Escherichia coli]|uniref:Signal peptide peptidase SppA, 67K type n=1 Tax=Escherichia coli TaxID=562 RepID=A0A376VGX7_ECOLX|nr:signal peptide peptidase SppA, 67K type [Escherichia coli]